MSGKTGNMKASIKFREDQKPIFKAKVPLSILGLPFQSGISAADSKELCLNLGTLFESGPSFKVSYRPSDSKVPFSLIVKTGIGRFGSPIFSPMSMNAEFNFLGDRNPTFFIHFTPQIGNFSFKRSVSSTFPEIKAHSNGSDINAEKEGLGNSGESPANLVANRTEIDRPLSRKIDSLLSGVQVNATTILPLRDRAELNLRWSVRLPVELKNPFAGDRTGDISCSNFPSLVLSKIGIELVASKRDQIPNFSEKDDVAGTCLSVKRQLEVLQKENLSMRKSIDELRSEIATAKHSPLAVAMDSGKKAESELDRNSGNSAAGKNWNKEMKMARATTEIK